MVSLRHGAMTLFVAFLFAFPSTKPSWAITGGEILKVCADYPEGQSPRSCELYVRSMIEFVTSGDKLVSPKGKLCIAEGVPFTEVVAVVNSWLTAHPELHDNKGYEATFGGLEQRYRCK